MSTIAHFQPAHGINPNGDLPQFLRTVGERLRSRQGLLMAAERSFIAPYHEPYPFLGRAKGLVYNYIKGHPMFDNEIQSMEDVTVTWFNKNEHDWAVVLTAKHEPNIFYRVVHDSRAKETTLAVYDKFDIQKFTDDENYA